MMIKADFNALTAQLILRAPLYTVPERPISQLNHPKAHDLFPFTK